MASTRHPLHRSRRGAPSFSSKESRKAPTLRAGHLPLILRFDSGAGWIAGS